MVSVHLNLLWLVLEFSILLNVLCVLEINILATAAYKFSTVKLQISTNLAAYTISTYYLTILVLRSLDRLYWVHCLRSHKAEIKVLVRLGPYLKTLGKTFLEAHSGCWQSPVTCNHRFEVPVSLLAVSHGLFFCFYEPPALLLKWPLSSSKSATALPISQRRRLGFVIDSVKKCMAACLIF